MVTLLFLFEIHVCKILFQIIALTSLQGGSNAGEITRVIMRSIMTNNCMSQFSGCGQKGKRAFIGTQLYKIVLCMFHAFNILNGYLKFLLYDKCLHTQTYIYWHSIHYNYLFFLSAAARKASKKSIPFETIKREVLDVLRFAPNQPGGTNYVKVCTLVLNYMFMALLS